MSWWNKEAEEEEEEENDDEFKTCDDHIVFLIDARAPMFELNGAGQTHISNCLSMSLAVMKSKIISSENSSIGIIFFGSKNKDSESITDGVFNFMPLAPPSAERMRSLQSLIRNPGDLESQIGSQSGEKLPPLKQAFWACSQSFDLRAGLIKPIDYRRVWLFTCDDDPFPSSLAHSEREQVVRVGKDLAQAGGEISLWHISRLLRETGGSEDQQASESEIEARMMGCNREGEEERGAIGFDCSVASVRRKVFKKRSLASTLFSLGGAVSGEGQGQGEGLVMGVKLYKTVNKMKRPLHTWLHALSHEPLKLKTRWIDGGTGEVLDDTQISTCMLAGGRRVPVEREEVKGLQIGAFGMHSQGDTLGGGGGGGGLAVDSLPLHKQKELALMGGLGEGEGDAEAEAEDLSFVGVRLLYTAPRISLSLELNAGGSTFLFPDEKRVSGSNRLFLSFLSVLSSRDLIGVCLFSRLASSPPVLAALLPQKEELDEEGVTLVPGGFFLIPLPFCNDLRLNPASPPPLSTLYDDQSDDEGEGEGGAGGSEQGGGMFQVAVSQAKELIDCLQLEEGFNYTSLQAPAIQQFYSVLQAVALGQGEDEVEWRKDRDDALRPDELALEAHSAVLSAFKDCVGLSEDDLLQAVSKKRAAPSGKTASKKNKAEGGEGAGAGDLLEKVKSLAANDQLMSLTQADLKEACSLLGEKVSGNKSVLVDRIKGKLGM